MLTISSLGSSRNRREENKGWEDRRASEAYGGDEEEEGGDTERWDISRPRWEFMMRA